MSENDETRIATRDGVASPLPSDDPAALLVDAKKLIAAFRELQQRVPEFAQLSLREERSLMRAAYLAPEFIETGIRTTGAWHEAKTVLGWTDEELRAEMDAIREIDELEQTVGVLLKGIGAAKLKRKHRLGEVILQLYSVLRITVDQGKVDRTYLRPYLEEMKRAYLKSRTRRAKAEAEPDPETPKD